MEKFRVALSADFKKPDGSPAYPVFDLTPLTSDPRVELVYVQPENGVMPAAGLEGCDALILLVPSVGFMLLIERFLKADVLAKVGS